MRVNATTAKALLAAFLLTAQLCPCPASAADPAAPMHGASDAMADCHGEASREDCGMAEAPDVDGLTAKLQTQTDGWASAPQPSSFAIGLDRISLRFSGVPPDLLRQTRYSPVALRDRMLD